MYVRFSSKHPSLTRTPFLTRVYKRSNVLGIPQLENSYHFFIINTITLCISIFRGRRGEWKSTASALIGRMLFVAMVTFVDKTIGKVTSAYIQASRKTVHREVSTTTVTLTIPPTFRMS